MRDQGARRRPTARTRAAGLTVLCAATAIGLGAVGTAAASAAPARPMLKLVKHGKLGDILVTTAGKTVYIFTGDSPNKPTCTGGCAHIWPPVTVAKRVTPKGARGVSGLGTVVVDGIRQVTWDKHPLYTYALDARAGIVHGNGVQQGSGTWWAATKKRVTSLSSSPATTKPTTSNGSTGPGYGYGY